MRSRLDAVPVKVVHHFGWTFCHASGSSIASAEPTTLTQPTHGPDAGAGSRGRAGRIVIAVVSTLRAKLIPAIDRKLLTKATLSTDHVAFVIYLEHLAKEFQEVFAVHSVGDFSTSIIKSAARSLSQRTR